MKTLALKILPVVCILLITLGGCSKEERQESKITGKWNTTSLKRNGTEKMKIWFSYSFPVYCKQGGQVTCTEKWQLSSFMWEINEDGTAKQISSREMIDVNRIESEKQCIPITKPQYTDNSSSDYTWKLSSDGKTLTIQWSFGESEYEVQELSKKILRLRNTDSGGDVREYKMERQ